MNKETYVEFEREWSKASENAVFANEVQKSMAKGWFFQSFMTFKERLEKQQEIIDHYREILVDEGQIDEHEYKSEIGELKRKISDLSIALERAHEGHIFRRIDGC